MSSGGKNYEKRKRKGGNARHKGSMGKEKGEKEKEKERIKIKRVKYVQNREERQTGHDRSGKNGISRQKKNNIFYGGGGGLNFRT
jgi:hypothetical protein